MESCEYRRDRACLAVGVGDGWRGRQDSRTLRMRGIWTGSSGGNEHEGKRAGGIGKKSWRQPQEDLEHKAEPRTAKGAAEAW